MSRGEFFFALALISSLKKKEMNIIGKGCQICVDRERINCEKERQGVPNNERDRKDLFILRMPWRKNLQKEITYVDSLFP